MNTYTQIPSRLCCTAQDLVDAIPLRLSGMVAFTTAAGAHGENDSRLDRPPRRELRGRYLPAPAPSSLFRVHN